MDQRIVILRPDTAVTVSGASRKQQWVASESIWAERVNMTGRNVLEAQEHFADYSVQFNIRAAHTVRENWRVRHVGGYLYKVANIIPNRRKGMQTLCLERINE